MASQMNGAPKQKGAGNKLRKNQQALPAYLNFISFARGAGVV
jgi:hypothetical protein